VHKVGFVGLKVRKESRGDFTEWLGAKEKKKGLSSEVERGDGDAD